jgi:hypothetical protein
MSIADVFILALRVEWCKAYARMRRWHEDIVLVEEEMRCTIEYGAWMAAQWEMHATARSSNTNPMLAEGLRMYACEHTDHEQRTCVLLTKQWGRLRAKVCAYLAGIAPEVEEEVVIDVDDVDPDDEEGDVEGDELVDDGGAGDNDQEDTNDV